MFENIIFEIMDAVKNDDNRRMIEENIDRMIEQYLTRSEVVVLARGISTAFRRTAKIAYISNVKNNGDNPINRIIKRFYSNKQLSDKAWMYGYKKDLIIIITMNDFDENRFGIILEEIIDYCELGKPYIFIGYSNAHATYERLDYCLKEAYYAHIIGQIENRKTTDYEQIGTYKFLIPEINSENIMAFMNSYLDPVFGEEEQLKTAIQFVLSKGDIGETAERLICHKNTVRYRIKKLKETLDPEVSDAVFYENLSTAIKTYLLKRRSD